jgi:hypothetical protein
MRLDRIFVEPKELNDLKDIPGHAKLVWNSRDLITGNKKIESFVECRFDHTERRAYFGGFSAK